MSNPLKKFLIAVCFLSAVFGVAMAMLGLCVAVKIKTFPGYIFSGIGSLIIVALLLSTRDVWKRGDAVHRMMRIFWAISVLVQFFAVLLGCGNHVLLQNALRDSTSFSWREMFSADAVQLATVAVLTIFLTAAPIGVSYLWRAFFEDEEEESERAPVRPQTVPKATIP